MSSKKIRLNIWCELSARQTIHIKCQVLFSLNFCFLQNFVCFIYQECRLLYLPRSSIASSSLSLSFIPESPDTVDDLSWSTRSFPSSSLCLMASILGPLIWLELKISFICIRVLQPSQHCQLPFLNRWKGKNDHRKYFIINLHERMLLTQWEMNPHCRKTESVTVNFCLCWGFTAQSTQWGHVERGQFT